MPFALIILIFICNAVISQFVKQLNCLKIIYSGTRRSVFQMIVADIASCCDLASIGNLY
jgi:hypothetical protein